MPIRHFWKFVFKIFLFYSEMFPMKWTLANFCNYNSYRDIQKIILKKQKIVKFSFLHNFWRKKFRFFFGRICFMTKSKLLAKIHPNRKVSITRIGRFDMECLIDIFYKKIANDEQTHTICKCIINYTSKKRQIKWSTSSFSSFAFQLQTPNFHNHKIYFLF